MMILKSSPPSPFGRKIVIAAHILGLQDQIRIEPADTMKADDPVRQQNPVGKIPTLITEDGTALFDSRVILEYLDHRAGGGRILPKDADARFGALRLQALADGVTDASLLVLYEGRFRAPEKQEPKWLEHQNGKIERGFAALEAEVSAAPAHPATVGDIALACLLGHRDLRFAGSWRAGHPRLVAWLDRFSAQVPAFEATRVTP